MTEEEEDELNAILEIDEEPSSVDELVEEVNLLYDEIHVGKFYQYASRNRIFNEIKHIFNMLNTLQEFALSIGNLKPKNITMIRSLTW